MCPFCFATEAYYFDGSLCRRCIAYRCDSSEDWDVLPMDPQLQLPLTLTDDQKQAAQEIMEHCFTQHVCVEAVCGAGKTEMCVPLIEHCLKRGKSVCWATPRKQIVIELADRLQSYFVGARVMPVYGGHSDVLHGDLIVCTTHQLFRYRNTFDLVILDEPDAFPFKGNDLLKDFLRGSLKGYCVFLSATFDAQQFSDFGSIHTIAVNRRPSQEPLVVPKVTMSLLRFYIAFLCLKKEKVLVFVPTISIARWCGRLLNCPVLTSQSDDGYEIVEHFKKEDCAVLVTTTVLERGVTFRDCFVLVYDAGHPVFDEASLIQIAGRVRRGMNPTKGSCLFYVKERSEVVEACIRRIQAANDAGYAFVP